MWVFSGSGPLLKLHGFGVVKISCGNCFIFCWAVSAKRSVLDRRTWVLSIRFSVCFTFCYISVKQAVIEANIIHPLVHLLQHAEFDIKKEAAWAISNATSGGSHDQIRCVVCSKPPFYKVFPTRLLAHDWTFPFWSVGLA